MLNKLSDDVKTALKSGDKIRANILRMVIADLKYARVEGAVQKDLTDEEELAVVLRYVKKLEKALPDYEGTPKKVEIQNEISIVEEYLPKKASPEEIENFVKSMIAGTEERNFGKLMKIVMERFGASADGKLVSSILKSALS